MGSLYEHGIRVSQRIQLGTGVVLAPGASAPIPFSRLDTQTPCLHGCFVRRKPAKSGAPDAVSTGNNLRGRQIQRRREIVRLKSRRPRHYPRALLVTWARSEDGGDISRIRIWPRLSVALLPYDLSDIGSVTS